MRVIISVIQQYLKNGTIQDIRHVKTNQQITNIFTKKGVQSYNITHAISYGNLHCLTPHNSEEGQNVSKGFLTLQSSEEGVKLPLDSFYDKYKKRTNGTY